MYFLCTKQANLSEKVKLKATFALGINHQPTWSTHVEFLFAKIMVNMEILHVLKTSFKEQMQTHSLD